MNDDVIMFSENFGLYKNPPKIKELGEITTYQNYGYIKSDVMDFTDIIEGIKNLGIGDKDMYKLKAKKIIFNGPATIIIWEDGNKTICKCMDIDTFDPEKGIAMCFLKRLFEINDWGSYKRLFKTYIPDYKVKESKQNYFDSFRNLADIFNEILK